MFQNQRFNNKFIFILISVFFLACNNKKSEDIIAKNEFINILLEVHLANATLNYMQSDKNWKNYKNSDYYPSILKKHNVTVKDFNNTIQYYIKKPDEYDAIYDSVINRLSVMQGEISTKIIEEKKQKSEN